MASGSHSAKTHRKSSALFIMEAVIFIALVAVLFIIVSAETKQTHIMDISPELSNPEVTGTPVQNGWPTLPANTETTLVTDEPVPTEEPFIFEPYCTENTDPDKLIKTVGVNVDGTTLAADEEYAAAEPIEFGLGKDYTDVQGIVTFRGDNFRSGASYGLAEMTELKFGENWHVSTGTTQYGDAVWTGSGWVGQPLIVKWPSETKAVMNMYEWAKQDDELIEVIYATMDGNIYFLDLKTGAATRDKLNLGYAFKGSGALDPRGYPILYLGAGYDSNLGTSRTFIINLLDCSVMYTFGNNDPFSLRGTLSYFDSSALVDAETDQLIYPGENGILYIIKLNTEYDEKAGTLSIDPSPVVKWHYYGTRTSLNSYWVGMESSAVTLGEYIIMCDNGGNLMCLNLNTLELVWVQDILDDSNGSPVLSIEDGHPYIYISTSYHYGWRSWTTAKVPIWKIDAENGEKVWQTDYTCYTESGVSGGVQSTIALGKNNLEGKIYVTVARTPSASAGVLACIDRENGEVLWEHSTTMYTWSSPVLVYNSDGSGYVCYCTYGSYIYLIDGETGEVYDSFNVSGGVEASPAVYEDWLVIGTRKCLIWGIHLR